jgi:hypothetical protein
MRKSFPAACIPLLGTLVLPTMAKAADFPSQLWGRSIAVNWNTSGEDLPSSVRFNGRFSVYVSGAGRTFSRMMASHAQTTRSEPTAASVYFENGALLADAKIVSGALRVAITFDAAYGKCSATVIFDGQGGEPVRGKDMKASNCSITDRNVFLGR